jgi:hypothetical protein
MSTASYPSGIKSFGTDRIDGTDVVVAADVNASYAEIVALETVLGVSPTTTGFGGSYSTSVSPATVAARISNVEAGLNTAYTNRVPTTGGATIAPTAATLGLGLQAAASASANLLEARDSSNNLNLAIGPNAYILTIDGGTA